MVCRLWREYPHGSRISRLKISLRMSADVAHGDLKPENVLIHEDSSMTAKLIDFDSSSISGTRVWRAPELVRRNPMVRLSEAFRADMYSFGKLCAWIMFHKVLNIEDYKPNAGRTSFQRYETFDLGRAVEHGQLQSDGRSENSLTFPESSLLLLMEGFFSATFVGSPERRHGDISEVVQLLEEVLESARVMDIPCNEYV
jgi:serine/threonine protein kinase